MTGGPLKPQLLSPRDTEHLDKHQKTITLLMVVITSIGPIVSAVNFASSCYDGLFVGRGDVQHKAIGLGYFLFLVLHSRLKPEISSAPPPRMGRLASDVTSLYAAGC